jgi:succinate dehydrogenase / fumarate reductase cytochrome b subunit
VPDPAPDRSLLRRAFSLSGVVPLGAFLVVHLAANTRALRGERALGDVTRLFERIPALAVVEALLVFGPLLFHAGVGLWLVVARRSLVPRSPYPGALRIAVRVTGVLAIAFLAMHLPELRFRTPGLRPDGDLLSTLLASDLSSLRGGLPLRGLAYLLGTACVCFHFAAGLWGFFAATPRGGGARARRLAAWWAGAVGATMWLLFANVVVFHASGGRLFGRAPADAPPSEPCPPAP